MLIPIIFVALLAGLVGASYITNPFSKLSIIRRPFVIEVVLDTFRAIDNNHKLRVRQQWFWCWFAVFKCGIHILATRYVHSPRSAGKTIDDIIHDIHALRFNPDKLLLTSGDHFSPLFVRNLGVFYYPMLDQQIASAPADWHNRQIVYLQTVAYALGAFQKRPVPTTTIVSTGPYTATCINFYAYPSDTVYGILYALAALQGKEQATPGETYAQPAHQSDTKLAATMLTETYLQTLKQLYTHYRQAVFDNDTGLIKTSVHLSGAKDITRRRSAFYDNVIFWKTTQLAIELGLITEEPKFLRELKSRILDTFWLEPEGYFLEDLSDEGRAAKYYSSDWLIVLVTGFLQPGKPKERHYFERSIAYIQKEGIDQPFAIKYQQDRRAHRQFLLVRLTVASYGGSAVWSFWGMEYIKSLMLLYKHTGKRKYLASADRHIDAYKQAMLTNGGFPEVFDNEGKLLETPVYRSIRQTGWVIGFEQVLAMRAVL